MCFNLKVHLIFCTNVDLTISLNTRGCAKLYFQYHEILGNCMFPPKELT